MSTDLKSAMDDKEYMDSLIDLSRVTITVRGVEKYSLNSSISFGERLIYAFGDSIKTFISQLENIILTLIYMSWWILILLIIFFIVKMIHNRKNKIGITNKGKSKE